MVDINSNHVDDLRTLVNEDIARAICSKEGFEFVGDFEPVQQGAQAKLYTVKKNNVEYALKHYDSKSIGGYSEGFFNNPSGEFDETAFYKQLAIEDDRFKIEIALAKDDRLKKNKHIVNVAAAGRILFDDGVARQAEYYNIMEIYKPLSLDVISEPNIRNEREALRLGVQICDALITLHKCKDLFGQINYGETGRTKAILHSDIKYDNIFCYKEDNVYKYVLSDFGVSQLKATQTGSKGKGHGTAYTMAPEIASRYFSTKADLYSLCATIYLLVNKGTIFDAIPRPRVKDDVNAESGWIVIYKGTMPPPLNCTKELQELLVNGLEYDREKRNCKSAKELMTAFQKVQYTNAKKAYDEGNIEECSHFLHDLKEEDIFDNRLLSDIEQLERNKNRCGEITVCVENDEIYGVEVMGYYFERQENEDVLAFFNNRIVPELLRNEGISLKNYYYRDNVRVVNLNEFLAEKRKKEVNNNRCSTKEIPDNGIKSNDEKPDEKRTGSHRKPITTKHKNEEEKKENGIAYYIKSLLIISAIILALCVSVEGWNWYITLPCLIATYVLGHYWLKKKLDIQIKQKRICLISILTIVLTVDIVVFICDSSHILSEYILPYVNEVSLWGYNIGENIGWILISILLIIFIIVNTALGSFNEIYAIGAITSTFYNTNSAQTEGRIGIKIFRFIISVTEFIASVIGFYFIFITAYSQLTYLNLCIIMAVITIPLIYGFVKTEIINRISMKEILSSRNLKKCIELYTWQYGDICFSLQKQIDIYGDTRFELNMLDENGEIYDDNVDVRTILKAIEVFKEENKKTYHNPDRDQIGLFLVSLQVEYELFIKKSQIKQGNINELEKGNVLNPHFFGGKETPIEDFIIENGVLRKYNGKAVEIVIPENVVEIGDGAFFENKELRVVQFSPSKIKRIGVAAFYGCSSLVAINGSLGLNFDDSVEEIRSLAFMKCSSIKSVSLPKGLKLIGTFAFYGCSNLEILSLDSNQVIIDEYAFKNCNKLMNIEIDKKIFEKYCNRFDG